MVSFQKGGSVAYILRVSELKRATERGAKGVPLGKSLPKEVYLVQEQLRIPPLYYSIPSIAHLCEQTFLKFQEELAYFAGQLGVPSERCLQVGHFFTSVTQTQLQRYLVRRLKRPVRVLTLAELTSWREGLSPTSFQSGRPEKYLRNNQGITNSPPLTSLRSSALF